MNNKLRVLLLPPTYDILQNGDELPMGIAYIAGYLKQFEWIDLNVPQFPKCQKTLTEILSEKEYDAVCTGGMFVYHKVFQEFFDLSSVLQKNATRILGGAIVESLKYDEVFDYLKIDIAIRGEGEDILAKLLSAIKNKDALENVNGIIFKENGKIKVTAPALDIDLNKNNLIPDWSWFTSKDKTFNRMPILASRGCPNRCDFCHSPYDLVRKRNVEDVINEIKFLQKTYKVKKLIFMDETFTANSRRMQKLCEEITSNNIDITWQCGVRTNLVSYEVLCKMKLAGCNRIQLGVESGSDVVLKRMNKNSSVTHNKNAIELIRKAKIQPLISVMFGYYEETIEELKSTVDFLIEINELPEYMSHTTPVPGTALYDRSLKNGLINVNNVYEYISNMNQGIYLTRKPLINLTKIPNEIYWNILLKEKQRLSTTLANQNRLHVVKYEEQNNKLKIYSKCPHCNSSIDFNQSFRWISKQFCNNCQRYVWFHLEDIDIYNKSYNEIKNMLIDTKKKNKKLFILARTALGMGNLYSIFYHTPWKNLWEHVNGVSSLSQFLYFQNIKNFGKYNNFNILDVDSFTYEEMKK